jgi:fructokinase
MKFRLVGIGEVLWDLLPGGPQLGGAPANFAYHARELGAEASAISRVGDDDLGREVLARLKSLGLPMDCVEIDPRAPTGTVTVKVDPNGEPHFTIHEGVAWDNLSGGEAARLAVSRADAVCFGTLAQRLEPSRSTIRSLVRAAPPAALRILDVNLRQHYYSAPLLEESLALSNVLKLNDAELPKISELLKLTGDDRTRLAQLAQRYQLRVVACTRGGNGSLLLANGTWSDHPGITVTVRDTVGAGDSFTAAMALGLLSGWDLDLVNRRANEVAACVASCTGATPSLPASLRQLFN